MRVLSTFACAAFLCATSIPAGAYGPAPEAGARLCTSLRPRPARRSLQTPPSGLAGWAFYLRQRLRADERAPLVIIDELGGVTLYRDRRYTARLLRRRGQFRGRVARITASILAPDIGNGKLGLLGLRLQGCHESIFGIDMKMIASTLGP